MIVTKFVEETELMNRSVSKSANHQQRVKISLADARQFSIPDRDSGFDLLMSSPPYGDNRTTIPYGQFSYLPTQWIPMENFVPELKDHMVKSTHALDTASLGGSNKGALKKAAEISDISTAFAKFEKQLKAQDNVDGIKRAGAFTYDFLEAIRAVDRCANSDAHYVWVLGNRCISGREFPFSEITRELMESCGASHIRTFDRNIPRKRMPLKNSIGELMASETILVMKGRAKPIPSAEVVR
jgi:hypothetical protein